MDRVFGKLRNLDAYPKINEDFYSRTLSGGVITVVSSIAILLLFFSELRLYLHTVTETKLVVDTSRGETLHINFDVTFPSIPCSILSLDAMDISGEQHLDIVRARHDIFKKRIDSHGNVIEVRQEGIGAPKIEKPLQRHGGRLEKDEKYCGSCFGAEMHFADSLNLLLNCFSWNNSLNLISKNSLRAEMHSAEVTWGIYPLVIVLHSLLQSDDDCCNSCEEVREAYRKKGWGMTNPDLIDQCKREGFVQKIKDEEGEGCNIHGSLEVNKVAGNFHFALGKSFHQSNVHLNELLAFQNDMYNISHKINKLAFGDYFPGVVNPLDGVQWVHETPNGMYQYFIKVVPTIYTNVRGRTIQSNQFSVTEHFKGSEIGRFQSPHGVYFFYDLSPIKVTVTEAHTPFLHFLTHLCAIIGGIFTVAGIVDSFVYHGRKALKKKMEIGKFS
ncbi:hypothetical protein TEA_014633 [Camellia sinensis var. sinensis]|uniref:Endoplasmic reticulum vesicle transporter C-terminal domain-containing protein n=1 Tax=Camellia sinensis var. sinensis TaxID=542762 RepID=A0A4S4DWK2_CAMSN|nr:hypothetical protein TEA_014633 [Camellia sinensis var. sinensis]